MKITLVRHGQTENNKDGKIQGRANNMLNDEGRRQCKMAKLKIQDKHFDICYTSPLVRCVETSMILIGDKVKMVTDDRLIERDMGELEGVQKGTYDFMSYWDYELNNGEYGIEPIQDIFKRCEDFLNYIKEKNSSDSSILVVTHGATFRALRHLILKSDLKGDLFDSKIENCRVEEFEI